MKLTIPVWNWGIIRALRRESPNVEYKELDNKTSTEISFPDAVAANCAGVFRNWGLEDAASECEKIDLSHLREMAKANSGTDLRSVRASEILKDVRARVDAIIPPGQKVFEHQYVAIAFLEARNGRAMLADEQGGGKSIEALLWLKINPDLRPVIIFGPGFLCPQWETEIKKWMPEESCYIVEGGKDGLPLGPKIILMSYDLFAREPEKWFAQMLMLYPKVIICDQVELLKDFSAKRTRAVIGAIRALESVGGVQAVIPMSGGPLINRASEYYVPLYAVDPFAFAHRQTFEKMYCGGAHELETYKKHGRTRRFRRWVNTGDEKIHALKYLVSNYAIRRYKRDVFTNLPEFRRGKVTVQPEPLAYQRYLTACNNLKQAMLNPSNKAPQGFLPGNILAALVRARQEAGLCKIQPVAEWINYKLENDENAKVLAFCHHDLVMDAARNALETWSPLTIRGGDSYQSREEARVKFNSDPKARLLIAKTRAGGIGLNLQGATDVVFLERDWSPTKEVEGEARADRYSDDEIVKESTTAWYFHAKGTFDERVAVLLEQKKKIINAVVGEGKVVSLDVVNELLEELSREWGIK